MSKKERKETLEIALWFNLIIGIYNLFIFADMNIAEGHHDYWSYPGYPSHIDHILLTSPLENSFNNLHSSIKVLPVDLNFMNWDQYDFLVSDHRPVLLKLAY